MATPTQHDAAFVTEAMIFAAQRYAEQPVTPDHDPTTSLPTVNVFPPKTPRTLMMTSPITASECAVVWKFLCDWIKTQIAMDAPAVIPGFGAFSLKAQGMQIRIPYFEPEPSFIDKFALKTERVPLPPASPKFTTRSDMSLDSDSPQKAPPKSSDIFAFSYMEMASCCGLSVDTAKAQERLKAVLQKIGHAMNQSKRSPPPTIPFEIRTGESIVKRTLLEQTMSSEMPRKPTLMFLTGDDFSPFIQVNPASEQNQESLSLAFDVSKDLPGQRSYHSHRYQSSRMTSSLPVVANANRIVSPRSQQLHARHLNTRSGALLREDSRAKSTSSSRKENPNGNLSPVLKEPRERSDDVEVFDSLSRTLCAETDQSVTLLGPTNRIATNFTISASRLIIQKTTMAQRMSTSPIGAGLIFRDVEAPELLKQQMTVSSGEVTFIEPRVLPTSPRHKERIEGETDSKFFDVMDKQEQPFVASVSSRAGQEFKSEERYFEYINGDRLVKRDCLAPLSSKLTERIVASAVKYLTESPTEHVQKILFDAQQEYVARYYASVKKAMLDYILMNENSCRRLGIPHGVPEHAKLPNRWIWGNSNGVNGSVEDLKMLALRQIALTFSPTQSSYTPIAYTVSGDKNVGVVCSKKFRRDQVKAKLNALIMHCDPQIRGLQSTWHEIESSVFLVDLPIAKMSCATMNPIDVCDFEKSQLGHAAQMRKVIMEKWYSRAKRMLEITVQSQISTTNTSIFAIEIQFRHLLDSIATLMSLQIRSLVMQSVRAYLGFFELFAQVPSGPGNGDLRDTEMNGDLQNCLPYPGLLVSLVLHNGQIQFQDPLTDIPSRLLNVLHNLLQLFHNIGRIETQLDTPLALSSTTSPFLWNVAPHEEEIALATIRIREIIERNLSYLRKLQTDYDNFAIIYRHVNSVDCRTLGDTSDVESCRIEVESIRATASQLTLQMKPMQYLGLFTVDCRFANCDLLTELAQWSNGLLLAFQKQTSRLNGELRRQYKDIAATLTKKPMDLHELVDAEAFIDTLKTLKIHELQEKAKAIKQRLRLLLFDREHTQVEVTLANMKLSRTGNSGNIKTTAYHLSSELLRSTAKTIKWHSHINKILQDTEASLANERARIEAIFLAKRSRFLAEIEEFDMEVKGFAKKGDLRHAATYVTQLGKMGETMASFRNSASGITVEEAKLDWKPTDFSKLDDIAEEMEPYDQMWNAIREFRDMSTRWLRSNLFDLQASEGMQALQNMITTMSNVAKMLKMKSIAAAITADMVKKQISDFRENARLVAAILHPAMKERHFKEISTLLGVLIDPHEPITLLKLLEDGALDHTTKIVEICENAAQERQVEKALSEICNEWEDVRFQFKPLKKTPTEFASDGTLDRILRSPRLQATRHFDNATPVSVLILSKSCIENITALIEDHQARLQSLVCMPYAAPFANEISSWQQFMTKLEHLMELLVGNECLWKALSPLFSANIVANSTDEAKLFAHADQLFKLNVSIVLNQPICKDILPRILPVQSELPSLATAMQLFEDLETCHKLLERVRETVRIGLDNKRAVFPRFYFLSDSELVIALSSYSPSKNDSSPSSIFLWKSLRKCFPGVHHVNVNAAKEITSLASRAGETCPLGSPIVTTEADLLGWLPKVETSMKTILQASIQAATKDLGRKEFRKWCLLWPEQIVLVTVQYTWAMQCEKANRQQNLSIAWSAVVESLKEKLIDVTKEIKAAAHSHVRLSLSNVVLLLTHLRDVSSCVGEELSRLQSKSTDQETNNVESLTWIAYPRFHYDEVTMSVKFLPGVCLPYGFEYLGNILSPILLTPLTLRCFQSIAQASSVLAKGVCIQGAPEVGKSTSCYELSRLCGRLYVAYDCRNTPSFESLMLFIKGVACCAAWLCVENLQMLKPAYVSMTAMLCAQVMNSLISKQTQSTILGSKLRLRRGGYFIIILPRPVSLLHGDFAPEARFFFKSVIIQSPDIEKLAEFYLALGKFINTTALAKFIYATLSAFDNGLTLLDTGKRVESLNEATLNLRAIRKIVEMATQILETERNHEKYYHQVHRESDTKESTHAPPSGINDTFAMEKVEHKSVYIALREHLCALVPAPSYDLVEFVLRDFSVKFLAHEVHMTKGLLPTAHRNPLGKTDATSITQPRLEDAIETVIRTNEDSWKIFGPAFLSKSVQLLHAMQDHRLVIISGDIQSGKTSLYTSLARALSQLQAERDGNKKKQDVETVATLNNRTRTTQDYKQEIVAHTQCVVVYPRALTLDVLYGSSNRGFTSTALDKVIREAKSCYRSEQAVQTWLVLDGDLDSLWSEQLLYAVERSQDTLLDHPSGLLLSMGNHLVFPQCIRLLLETTVLTNISPSFISRVNLVNAGTSPTVEWRGLYRVWKKQHKVEFSTIADEIYSIIDILVEETLDATLDFVETDFQLGVLAQTRISRVTAFLALFHSLLMGSWSKLCSLASIKQRKTAIDCFYIQALVWGIGNTADILERHKFHLFLHHLIIHGPHSAQSTLKRVLALLFPSNTMGNGTAANVSDKAINSTIPSLVSASIKDTIFDFGFSVEFGLKWMRWPEYYDNWLQSKLSILATRSNKGNVHGAKRDEPDDQSNELLSHLSVLTASQAAAVCSTNQLLSARYLVLLVGPGDSGKTLCGSTWLRIQSTVCNDTFTSSSSATGSFGAPQEIGDIESWESQRMYVGYHTTASNLIEQLEPFLDRRRRTAAQLQSSQNSESDSSRILYVYVDDLHCVDMDKQMDTPLELLRMITQHRQVVHPRFHRVIPCPNLLPFASIHATNICGSNSSRDAHDLSRIIRRFIPVSLPALTDADIASICSYIVSDSSNSLSSSTTSDFPDTTPSCQEATPFKNIVIKASIKLFRWLTGEFGTKNSRKFFFLPNLHHLIQVRDVFQVVQSVCCDANPVLTAADVPVLARLWCHESARIFADRFSEPTVTKSIYQNVRDIALSTFNLPPDMFFPSFMDPTIVKNNDQNSLWLETHLHFTFVGENAGVGFRNEYCEVNDLLKVELSIERSMMSMHRANTNGESLEIILCDYVIQHVLRLTRLLRIDGQHVLLLGSIGKKMTTITRLAVFICKKVANVYTVPPPSLVRDGSTNLNNRNGHEEWKCSLKNAILQSVRNRDEKVVFIWKDAFAECTTYYETLDRFLSGDKLLSDMITHEDLDDQILCSIHEEVSQAGNQGKLSNKQTMMTKDSVMNTFYDCVRRKFQVVAIFSKPPTIQSPNPSSQTSGLDCILWRFPHLMKACAINYFGEWRESSLITIAQKCFALSPIVADKDRMFQLSQIAVKIYQRTKQFLERANGNTENMIGHNNLQTHEEDASETERIKCYVSSHFTWYDRPSPFLKLDPSMLVDQIGLFLSHYEHLDHVININKAKYASGLEFLSQTEQILHVEQAQADALNPEMRRKSEFTRKMSGNLERERAAANKIVRGLELATSLAESQRERLANAEHEYEELIRVSREVFHRKREAMRVFLEAIIGVDGAQEEEIQTDASKITLLQAHSSNDHQHRRSSSHQDGLMVEGLSATSTKNDTNVAESGTEFVVLHAERDDDPRRRYRALVKSFVSIKPVPTSLQQLAECLGLILGIEPVSARDSMYPEETFMDYWESTTSRMTKQEFWNELCTFDVASRVTEKVIAELLPICTSPDFEKEMFGSLHELAGVLCEWVQACAEFARDLVLAEPKFAQLQHERDAFAQADVQVTARKQEMEAQSTTTSQINALRHISELERQEIEKKLRENTSTLQMISSVWKVLASSRSKWQQKYEYYTEFSAKWMGDLMIATSIIAYASCLGSRTRLHLRKEWAEELAKYYLLHTPNRSMPQVFLISDVQLAKWQIEGLQLRDVQTVENAVLITQSYRFPLIIDPDGIMTQWMKNRNGVTEVSLISTESMTDNAIWKEVERAAKKQSILLLVDVCEEQAHMLECVIGTKRRARFDIINRGFSSVTMSNVNGTNNLSRVAAKINHSSWCYPKIKGISAIPEKLEFTGNFCVYFVYSQTRYVPPWMERYMSQLNVIYCGYSVQFMESKYLQLILEAQGRQHVHTEIRTLQVDMITSDEQMDAIENELLEFFSTEKPDDVYTDVTKALKIVGNRSAMHSLKANRNDSRSKVHALTTKMDRYQQLVHRCTAAAHVSLDIAYLDHQVECSSNDWTGLYDLSWVSSILGKSLQICGSDATLEEVMRMFTIMLRHYTIGSLGDDRQLPFMFMYALRIHQRRVNSQVALKKDRIVSNEDANGNSSTEPIVIDLVYRLLIILLCKDEAKTIDIRTSISAKLLAMRPDCFPAHKWRKIALLAEASSTLREFIIYTPQEQQNAVWKRLIDMDASDSCNWEVPPPLTSLLRLCLVSVTYNHRFLSEVEQFTESELMQFDPTSGIDDEDRIETKGTIQLSTLVTAATQYPVSSSSPTHTELYQLWNAYSNPKTPLVISCSSDTDFVQLVHAVATKAKATIDRRCQEALTTEDDEFARHVIGAMEQGHWVVMPNLHAMPKKLKHLRSIYQALDNYKVHADFRLWISMISGSDRQYSLWIQSNGSWLARTAVRKTLEPRFGFKRNLCHAFSLIKQEIIGSTSSGMVEVKHEKLLKSIGIFHALVSSRDHFAFAQWKTRFEFGDADLIAALKTTLRLVDGPPPSTPRHLADAPMDPATWNTVTLAISNIYTSKLDDSQDKLLLGCCLDLVFGDENDAIMLNTAKLTIPTATFALHQLSGVDWKTILDAARSLWFSDELGPRLPSSNSPSGWWDPQHIRRARHRQFSTNLLSVLLGCGDALRSGDELDVNRAHVQDFPTVELFTKFTLELEAYGYGDKSRITFVKEYKKPLHYLFQHEMNRLNTITSTILSELKLFYKMHAKLETHNDPFTWAEYYNICWGRVPVRWLRCLAPNLSTNYVEGCTLDRFQQCLLCRWRFFALQARADPNAPVRISLDKFQSSNYVFEAVHQHFTRNYVGNTQCESNCLRVTAIFEDSAYLTLPRNENAVYIYGCKLMGDLQFETRMAREKTKGRSAMSSQERWKSITISSSNLDEITIRPEGIPVVLEVSSTCLSASSAASRSRHASEQRPATDSHDENGPGHASVEQSFTAYPCPIFRDWDGPNIPKQAESNIVVLSHLPFAQLVFSGTRLQICSFE